MQIGKGEILAQRFAGASDIDEDEFELWHTGGFRILGNAFGEGDHFVGAFNVAGVESTIRFAGVPLRPGHYRRRVELGIGVLREAIDHLDLGVVAPNESEPGRTATAPTVNIRHLSISGSTVGALNLGQIIGDMETRVGVLNEHGAADVAEAVTKLTEAVIASANLSDEARRAATDILSFLAEEAAAEPDRRRTTMIRDVFTRLAGMLSLTADVTQVWQTYGPLLVSYFGVN